jgi:hypothetical protein
VLPRISDDSVADVSQIDQALDTDRGCLAKTADVFYRNKGMLYACHSASLGEDFTPVIEGNNLARSGIKP